ncbi:MAG: DUF6941 family protein [Planctomycetota bacterium]|jgi:hypothetical protein
MSSLPVVRAILLADEVYQDLQTGKFVIAGTFDQIVVPEFPGEHPSSALYVNLGDFHGSHELSVRLIRLDDGFEVGRSPVLQIEQDDRDRHEEFRLPLPPMQFDTEGPYALEVLWDHSLLGECRIQVVQA